MPISWKDRRVLVTGGTGFFGSFLVEELIKRSCKVRVAFRDKEKRLKFLAKHEKDIEWVEADLEDPRSCENICKGVDEVMHLASHRRNVAYHQEHSGEVALDNVQVTANLAEALMKLPPIPVTFVSTANIPLSYDPLAVAMSDRVDGYVLGKALSEALLMSVSRQHQVPLLIPRLVGIYGPRDVFSITEGNAIPMLIMKAEKATDVLQVWGSGKQERSFLFVQDAAAAILALREADARGIQYVAPKETVTAGDLAQIISNIVHPGLKLSFDTSKPEGARSLPIPEVHSALKSFPWTPLAEGIRKTFEWYRNSFLLPS